MCDAAPPRRPLPFPSTSLSFSFSSPYDAASNHGRHGRGDLYPILHLGLGTSTVQLFFHMENFLFLLQASSRPYALGCAPLFATTLKDKPV